MRQTSEQAERAIERFYARERREKERERARKEYAESKKKKSKNPFGGDRMQMTAKRKRAITAARKLQRTKFPSRPEYEIVDDIMSGLLTFSGKPTVLGRKVGAYENPGTKSTRSWIPTIAIAGAALGYLGWCWYESIRKGLPWSWTPWK